MKKQFSIDLPAMVCTAAAISAATLKPISKKDCPLSL